MRQSFLAKAVITHISKGMRGLQGRDAGRRFPREAVSSLKKLRHLQQPIPLDAVFSPLKVS